MSKIKKLYDFLSEDENRQYNIDLQYRFRKSYLSQWNTTGEKVYAQLHNTYNTQSQPKLDPAKDFFKELNQVKDNLNSFKKFSEYIVGFYDSEQPYLKLFENLIHKNRGWGPKTGALFIKNIYEIHYYEDEKMKELAFWGDAPELKSEDRLMLPVDAVIIHIFKNQIEGFTEKVNFKNINNYLYSEFGNNMSVWDDLWFWGFITQKNVLKKDINGNILKNKKGNNTYIRKALEFNEGKYWSLIYAPKDEITINKIKEKCKEFVNILNQ